MLIDLLRSRRSIRRFTDQPVGKDQLDQLVEAAVRSFSSKGSNPWEFVVVQDRATLEALATAKAHGSSFLRHAPLAIAVCADPAKSDVWVEDTAIAAAILHLQAQDLGLGSCWVQIRLRDHDTATSAQDYVANLLNLPPGMMVLAIVGIGHPEATKGGHPLESLPLAQVSWEKFGQRD
jgi:nitroreductase